MKGSRRTVEFHLTALVIRQYDGFLQVGSIEDHGCPLPVRQLESRYKEVRVVDVQSRVDPDGSFRHVLAEMSQSVEHGLLVEFIRSSVDNNGRISRES